MKKVSKGQLLAGAVLFGAGLVSGLMAQGARTAPPGESFRTELKRADLSGAPGMEVIASIVEFKPGESSTMHFHNGIEAAYVLQGSTVQSPGQAPVVNATGSSLLNLRDARHGEFKVVGDTPLRIFAVHIVDKGKPLYEWVSK